MGRFVPVGIKIQPRDHNGVWNTQSPTIIRFRFYVRVNNGHVRAGWHWGPEVTVGPFTNKHTIKTIILDPSYRIKFRECDHMYIYTRHGRNSQHTSFRINFLIGREGQGYCVDKGSVVRNGHGNPVDCSLSGWRHSVLKLLQVQEVGLVNLVEQHTNRKNIIQEHNAPKNGGKNNCSTSLSKYSHQL